MNTGSVSGEAVNVETWSGKGRSQENFPVGSVLISARLRPHIHAFYNFARNADDIADSPDLAPGDKLHRLGVMEDVLLCRAEDGAPSARALRKSLAEVLVAPRHSLDLLCAFRRDAVKTRYADWDELLDYCRYSAMPVGRHVLALHGERAETWEPSDALCAALQVLNHLQDVSRDLSALDRCYLPQTMLFRAGASLHDLRQQQETPGLRKVFNELLDRCDALNETARDLPRMVRDRRLRLETAVILGLSRRLALRLRRRDPLATRVALSRGDGASAVVAALRFLP